MKKVAQPSLFERPMIETFRRGLYLQAFRQEIVHGVIRIAGGAKQDMGAGVVKSVACIETNSGLDLITSGKGPKCRCDVFYFATQGGVSRRERRCCIKKQRRLGDELLPWKLNSREAGFAHQFDRSACKTKRAKNPRD